MPPTRYPQAQRRTKTAFVVPLRNLRTGGLYATLVLLTILFMAPFVWLFITALKQPSELAVFPIRWLPTVAQWGNFGQAITFIDFFHYAQNSLIIATVYSVLVTFMSALVGFGFARLKGPGKQFLFLLMLSTLMLPQIVTLIPTYLIFAKLQMVDTYWPWVFWGLSGSAFLIFLHRQFFSSLPKELEDAALIDGASYFRIFWQIFLPLSWPVLATALIISFTATWGDYIAPTVLLNDDNTTLAVKISQGYLNEAGFPLTNLMAAGAILYMLPVLVVFFFAQRAFVRGFVTSGLKG